MDETGRTRELSQFAGFPLVLLPIYTRCRGACVQNVDQLKEVLADSANRSEPISHSALFIRQHGWSRDVGQVSRARKNSAWLVDRNRVSTGHRCVARIDRRSRSAKRARNLCIQTCCCFSIQNFEIAKWIYGTDYSSRDVDLALKVASGGSDWIGRYSEWLYALLLFAGSVLCVALCYYLTKLKGLHRSRRSEDYDLFNGAQTMERENAAK